MRPRRAGVLYPPLLMLLAFPLGADPGAAEPEPQRLEYVQVTATRREAAEIDVPVAVTHVSAERIRAEKPDVLAEMLRGLPGTYFQQTTPGQGIPIIRGLKGSQVLHLVDGMRLNNAFFRNAPNQYLGLVDAFATASVEVVRGAAGSLYGADAMGGVVNVRTPDPQWDDKAWQSDGSVYTSYDSVDDSWVGRAEAQAARRGLGIRLGATFADHGDRENGAGDRLAPSGYRVKAADAKLLAQLNVDSDLMLAVQWLEQPATPRFDELTPGFGQSQPAAERFEFRPNRRSFLHARYRLTDHAGWIDDLEVHLARQVITDDRLTQDFGSSLLTDEHNRSELDGVTIQFATDEQRDLLVTGGLEYYADRVRSRRTQSDTASGTELPAPARFPDRSRMDSLAAFLAFEWQGRGPLTLGGGLRYSTFDIELPAAEGQPAVRLKPDDVTGDLHLGYEFAPGTKLVGNVGRGFRPPNIFDLGALGSRPGNRFNIANPDLRPESVWSYDLGLKRVSGAWQAEVFVFYMDYQDKITSVPTGAFTPDGRMVVRSENRDRVDIHGLEAGLSWLPREDLELRAVLNYTRGEERGADGNTASADRIPPLNGRLALTWYPRDDLRLESFLQFAGQQDRLSPRDIDDPRIDPMGTPGWGTLNLLLTWQAAPWAELGLRFENIGDKAYREHGSGIDAPGFNAGVWARFRF